MWYLYQIRTISFSLFNFINFIKKLKKLKKNMIIIRRKQIIYKNNIKYFNMHIL